MEQNQDSSLFGLSIDPSSKSHLAEAARWARFLAIVGFVVCILIVLGGIFFRSFFSTVSSRYGGYRNGVDISNTAATTAAVMYILMAILYFFPFLFLYRFATKMKSALLANDQDTLNTSFQNLKKMFRYVGVLTIIVLAIYVLFLVIGVTSGATTRF